MSIIQSLRTKLFLKSASELLGRLYCRAVNTISKMPKRDVIAIIGTYDEPLQQQQQERWTDL